VIYLVLRYAARGAVSLSGVRDADLADSVPGVPGVPGMDA
jgi:hypothetical protein